MTFPHVSTTLPCCLTGSHVAVVVGTKDRHSAPLRTVLCKASGLVYSDPQPTTHELRSFYSQRYRQEYKGVTIPKRKHILRAGRLACERLAKVAAAVPQGARVLDVGAGGGEFVFACQNRGFTACGIEPSEGYARFAASEYGVNVVNGFYQDDHFPRGQFDAVTLFHVLEHLDQPVNSLGQLSEYLRPGGKLFVEVPNVDCTLTAPHQRWHRGHLFNFSAATLAACGARAGLPLVSLETSSDLGVLFAVFKRPARPVTIDVAPLLAGAFQTTHEILSRHTAAAHFARPQVPLARFAGKLYRALNENQTLKAYRTARPAQLLGDLFAGKVA